MKYVVHNDPFFEYSQIGLADIAQAEALNPGNISTFSGDLSAFHAQGGKIITYHGRADDVRLSLSPVLLNSPSAFVPRSFHQESQRHYTILFHGHSTHDPRLWTNFIAFSLFRA